MASSSISGRSPISSIRTDNSEPIPAWCEPDGCGCSGSRAHVVVSSLLIVSFFIGFSFLFSFESLAWPSGSRITNADETQAVLFDSQLCQRRQNLFCLCLFDEPPHRHLGSPRPSVWGTMSYRIFIPEGRPS